MSPKNLMTIAECEKAIQVIEMIPTNIIGGMKAFPSGRETYLTASAQKKVEALERRITELSEGNEDDE